MLRFVAAFAAVFLFVCPAAAQATQWRVYDLEGLDAVLLIGAASGDVMQAEAYPEEIAWARSRFSPEALAALNVLDQSLRVQGNLTGPTLVNFVSAGPVDTLADVIATAEDPDRYVRAPLVDRGEFDAEDYAELAPLMPQLVIALRALQGAGFSAWRRQREGAGIAAGIAAVQAAVSGYDVIGENQRFLARRLDARLDIVVLAYCKPYGIRVNGQRFLTHYSWDAGVQLRTAAHEVFHTPYDADDWRLISRTARLRADPWMNSIVANHDPRFGYNSFEGILDEDSTQALDQIVAERLGVARNARQRWAVTSDDGMHVLAAALYQAMKEDGFDQRGGPYQDWLIGAFDRDMLTPTEVRRRAALIVGQAAVDRWDHMLARTAAQ